MKVVLVCASNWFLSNNLSDVTLGRCKHMIWRWMFCLHLSLNTKVHLYSVLCTYSFEILQSALVRLGLCTINYIISNRDIKFLVWVCYFSFQLYIFLCHPVSVCLSVCPYPCIWYIFKYSTLSPSLSLSHTHTLSLSSLILGL